MKMTSNGRRLQNIRSSVSQPPLIESSLTCKLKLKGLNKNQNSWNKDGKPLAQRGI